MLLFAAELGRRFIPMGIMENVCATHHRTVGSPWVRRL
jgi:hypothetical protein